MFFKPPTVRVFLPLAFITGVTLGFAAEPVKEEPLRNAAAVLSLSAEQAGRRHPITVTGVVTAAEVDWRGQFFVQDESGGVFVENLATIQPQPGDLVAVTGVSHPGAFAPIISEPHWQILGTAPLPAPKSVSIEDLESGVEDGLRVEIAGIVRAVRHQEGRLDLDVAVGGYRLEIRAPESVVAIPESLIAAHVRVRGTTATHYNAAVRHLTSVAVYVPQASDFHVLEFEAGNPFGQPVVPLNSVAQYRRDSGPGKRVHVRGTITLQRVGQDVFLQDSSGGIRVETPQVELFAPGDQVEAAGFLEFDHHLPLLRDAALKKSSARQSPVIPRVVPVADVKMGVHHADLITLRGKVLSQSLRPIERQRGEVSGVVTTWLVQGDGLAFAVELEARTDSPAFAPIPPGSLLKVSGVCFSEIDEAGKLKSLRLLIASPANLNILERPSWFTPARLLVGVGTLSVVLALVTLWLLTVARKNVALGKAQKELQEANDTLEEKVQERSAQLQVEMTARKAAELQFKAVLFERTRLARELHDSLEQTLTGIALHLGTAAKLFQNRPKSSTHHLQLARNWLRQSQEELRRSIWDLRSRELEQFDLANALRQSAEHLVDGTKIKLEFGTRGTKRSLPEIVEENVLRIGQEALTNIAKHAQANRISLLLEFSDHALTLRVEDNGVGFEHLPAPQPGDHRFGLIGMSERARRLCGQVVIESVPTRGTVIAVEIPLESVVSPVARGRLPAAASSPP
jgi:signal transduction histidine kinase